MKCFVYLNLHTKRWSVRMHGKVVAHADIVALRDVEFRVSEAGRQRVLRDRVKNVHAGVSGELVALVGTPRVDMELPFIDSLQKHNNDRAVWYSPYVTPTFITLPDRHAVHHAPSVPVIAGGRQVKCKGHGVIARKCY